MFKILAQINKRLLPSLAKSGTDPARMGKWEKALLAWRYYVTVRALGEK